MSPKVSVIIPMFDCEKYVGLALETVLAQTFRDFELILIDDCSTDRTLEIAEGFARSDRRIRIVRNEKNLGGEEGPGVVRNIGFELARGEYVYSMDNDDVIMPDGLQIMLDAARKTKADAIINTQRFKADNGTFESLADISNLEILSGKKNAVARDLKQRVWEEYVLAWSRAAPWSHFYRREFLERAGLRYPPMAVHDDGEFLIELLCSTDKIVKIAEPFYVWRKRAESITNSTKKNPDGSAAFEGFAKRVRSFLIMTELIDEVLSKAMMREYGEVDGYFIDTVCLRIKDRALIGGLHYFFVADINRSWEIIRAEVEKRYGKNSSMLRRMMYGYLGELFNNQKH